MRFSVLVLVSLLSGCAQLSSQLRSQSPIQPSAPRNNLAEQRVAIVEQLERDADLFFPPFECPGDVMPGTENAVQHRAEDCDRNPADCLKHCIAENGSACYGLALWLQAQEEIEKKYPEAVFLRACKLGIISGCTNRAAGMLASETNDIVALECIARTFEQTCAKEDPWGCTMYGIVLSQGIGRTQDLKKAAEVLPKACNKHGPSDPACQQAQKLREQILQNYQSP